MKIFLLIVMSFGVSTASNGNGDPQIDDTRSRAEFLCSELARNPFRFEVGNWSFLAPDGVHDRRLARELIGIGEDAVPFLIPLLEDKRRVVIAGSDYATVAITYQLRICDFAYRYYCVIRGSEYELSLTPELRDIAIGKVIRGESRPKP